MQPTWSFKTQASIWSSIKIDNNIAYFGSDDGNFYAVDLLNKQPLWHYKTNGKIRSTAAIGLETLYFSSEDGYLYALQKSSGTLVWKTSLNDGDVPRIEPAKEAPYRYDYAKSSPIIFDNTIYIGSGDQHLYSVDQNTGLVNWKFETRGIIRSTPAVNSSSVFFGSFDNTVYAVDRLSGQEQWKFPTYNVVPSSPVIIGDILVIGSRDTYLYGLNLSNGDEVWNYRFIDRSWVESTATPAKEEKAFFIGSSDSKKLLKFNAETGKEIWSSATPGWTWARPYLHGDEVYIGTTGARGYWNNVEPGFMGVSSDKGLLIRQYQPNLISGYVSGGVFGSPAVYNNHIYVPDLDGSLYEFAL